MRALTIISLLAFTGCSLRLPPPGQIGIATKTTVRVQAHVPAQVHVQGHGQVQGQVQVQGQGQGQVQVEAPSPPPPPVDQVIVAVQNAPVVEFFGIPLEGAQDVVFVLDCSGSMSNYAQGRLAQIQPSTSTAPPAPPPAEAQPGAPAEPPPPDPAPTDATQPAPTDAQPAAQPAAPPQRSKLEVAQEELVDALQRLPAGTRMNVVFFNSELEAYAPGLVPLDEEGRTHLIGFVRGTQSAGATALAPAMRAALILNAKRVVLLSDGLGNVGGNADAVLRDAREAIRGGVRIDTIGVGSGQHGRLLGTLAQESGGLYQAL